MLSFLLEVDNVINIAEFYIVTVDQLYILQEKMLCIDLFEIWRLLISIN